MKRKRYHDFEYSPRRKRDKEVMTRYAPNFKKLRIKFVKRNRKGWAGDWDAEQNFIKIDKDLDTVDSYGVIIHEFVEMMVTSLMGIPGFPHPDYDQTVHGERNQKAHDFANSVEKRILEMVNVNWEEHEQRIVKTLEKKKTKKKKI